MEYKENSYNSKSIEQYIVLLTDKVEDSILNKYKVNQSLNSDKVVIDNLLLCDINYTKQDFIINCGYAKNPSSFDAFKREAGITLEINEFNKFLNIEVINLLAERDIYRELYKIYNDKEQEYKYKVDAMLLVNNSIDKIFSKNADVKYISNYDNREIEFIYYFYNNKCKININKLNNDELLTANTENEDKYKLEGKLNEVDKNIFYSREILKQYNIFLEMARYDNDKILKFAEDNKKINNLASELRFIKLKFDYENNLLEKNSLYNKIKIYQSSIIDLLNKYIKDANNREKLLNIYKEMALLLMDDTKRIEGDLVEANKSRDMIVNKIRAVDSMFSEYYWLNVAVRANCNIIN